MKQIDTDALILHIKANQNKFYRLSYSYLNNEADAKDAIQNAIIKAFQNYSKLKNKDVLSTWFYRILVNECNDMLRKRKRTQSEDIDELFISADMDNEKTLLRKEQIKCLLNKMDNDLKSIILLHYFEDKTLNEIAQINNQPLSTIKSRLYRGLEFLRIQIKKEDYQ